MSAAGVGQPQHTPADAALAKVLAADTINSNASRLLAESRHLAGSILNPNDVKHLIGSKTATAPRVARTQTKHAQ